MMIAITGIFRTVARISWLILVLGFPALSFSQEYRAAFELDTAESTVLVRSTWGLPTHIGVTGTCWVEVDGTEVRIANRDLRTIPRGYEHLFETFIYLAAVTESWDTNDDGLADSWAISMNDDDCGTVFPLARSSYSGTISSNPGGSISGSFQLTGDWRSCGFDNTWFTFDIRANETQIPPPLPVPLLTPLGVLLSILALAAIGVRWLTK